MPCIRIAQALVVLAGCGMASIALAAEPVIAGVVRCAGSCVGDRDGFSAPLTKGAAVLLMETVSTGAGSRLELGFDDGTHLTLGEKATVLVDDFVYDRSGANRFHAAITGAFRYVSGKLAAGAARQASVTTPFAVIGVRGTDFWGGPIGGANGVVLFSGAVSVTTSAGTIVLSEPGQGTDIAAPNASPGAPTTWAADKVAGALATVAFP